MVVTVSQENLNKGLSLVNKAVSQKSTLPVLSNILIEARKEGLYLSSTNLETSITAYIPAKVSEVGNTTVPAKIFSDFINALPPLPIEVTLKDETLEVEAEQFRASLATISASEFPEIPKPGTGEILTIDSSEFAQNLNKVVFAASADEGRPVLNGVLFLRNPDELTLVATDGYRLSKNTIKFKNAGNLTQEFVLPARTLLEVARIAENEEGDISLFLDESKNQTIFKTTNVVISCRLIDGSYPEYERIIPKESAIKTQLPVEELLRSLRIAAIFAKDIGNVVKLKLDPATKTVEINAQTAQLGSGSSKLSSKIEGKEPLSIAFNSRFLLEGLAQCGSEITFSALNPTSPIMIQPKAEPDFIYIVMPVRVQG